MPKKRHRRRQLSQMLIDVRAVLRTMGWGDGSLYLAARVIRAISLGRLELRKYYFVSQPIPERSLLPAGRGLGIAVDQVDEHHPLVDRFPRPRRVIASRFASGSLCFAATKEDDFVGFLWLHRGPYLEDEVRCRFTPLPAERAVWDFDVHVQPEHRSGLAFARLWDAANQFLRDRGVAWSVSRILAFNPGSISSHVRLGAFPVGSACFLNGRRWQLLVSSARPYVHFSIGDESVPQIHLPANPSHRKRYRRFLAKA